VGRIGGLNVVCFAIFAVWGHAQQIVPPNSPTQAIQGSAATMEQTIGFINDSFAKQGQVGWTLAESRDFGMTFLSQSVEFEAPCLLVMRSTVEKNSPYFNQGHDKGTKIANIDLERTDPNSVSVSSIEAQGSAVAQVKIGRAVFQWRALDVPSTTHAEMLPEEYTVSGIILSISGTSITLVTDKAKLVSFTLDNNADRYVSSEQSHVPVLINELSVGDYVEINRDVKTSGKGRKSKTETTQSLLNWEKKTSSPRPFTAGTFADQDTADRVAKAFIHAIVLCHKDNKPSLF
jgi:hypothetical protein